MADLVVEFSRAAMSVPIEEGDNVLTEVVAIGAEAATDAVAEPHHNVVDIYAGAACWIEIATTPVAEVEGAGCRFMAEGERRQFRIKTGQGVSVIAAA